MKLIGQMFIVLIFIMSIVFCGFSIVIYSTHTDWKKRADDLKAQVEEAKTKSQQLETSKNDAIKQLHVAVSERTGAITSLNAKVEELDKESKDLKGELTKQNEEKEKYIADVKTAHDEQKKLRDEVDDLRQKLSEAQVDWATQYSTLVGKTDEAHSLSLQLATYQAVGNKLAQDYSDAVEVLKKHDLKPVPELNNGVPSK